MAIWGKHEVENGARRCETLHIFNEYLGKKERGM